MFYYLTRYSFDAGKNVIGPFKTEDDAWKAANDDADNERRIDMENGWTTDMHVHECSKEIELINYYNGNECITEYIVFEL